LKKEFKTKNGRKVFDGGGIEPDIKIELKPYSQLAQNLLVKQVIFDFATNYRNKHESIGEAKSFVLTEADYADFKKFVDTKDIDYSTQTEKQLEDLKKKAVQENYFEAIKSSYETMKNQLKHDKQADLDKNKEEIVSLIEEEIVRRYYYQKGRTEASFTHDNEIKAALAIFADPSMYQKTLAPTSVKK
jgi:carboxyl-terminal processing protease